MCVKRNRQQDDSTRKGRRGRSLLEKDMDIYLFFVLFCFCCAGGAKEVGSFSNDRALIHFSRERRPFLNQRCVVRDRLGAG